MSILRTDAFRAAVSALALACGTAMPAAIITCGALSILVVAPAYAHSGGHGHDGGHGGHDGGQGHHGGHHGDGGGSCGGDGSASGGSSDGGSSGDSSGSGSSDGSNSGSGSSAGGSSGSGGTAGSGNAGGSGTGSGAGQASNSGSSDHGTPVAASTTDTVAVNSTASAAVTEQAQVATAADGGGRGEPPHGSFREGEVVGLNFDADALAAANQMQFTVLYDSADPSGRFHLTRLGVPHGSDTMAALHALRMRLPGYQVELNSLYRLYQRAGSEASPANVPDSDIASDGSTASGACHGEDCAAWQMIGWSPRLQACSSGLPIGMIDTPVDTRHPALAALGIEHLNAASFLRDGLKPAAAAHGTGVAALLVGGAESGVPGLVPDSQLFAANTFYLAGGQSVTDTSTVVAALIWLARNGVKIVNMSFTGPEDDLLKRVITELMQKEGMVFVAAAGNDGPGAPAAYPAAYPGVIAVTAVTLRKTPYPRANQGFYIGLAAPGVHIWTAGAHGRSGYASGTSFAAPYVTAVIATLYPKSAARSAQALADIVPIADATTERHWDPVLGRGIIKAPQSCDTPATVASAPAASPAASFVAASNQGITVPVSFSGVGFVTSNR